MNDYNYFNDRRVCELAPTEFILYMNDREIQLPTYWVVCNVCNGEGKHVNPSIDAGGISMDKFNEDPDFASNYRSGVYDITCNRCGGKRVIKSVDTYTLPNDQLNAYRIQQDEESWAEAESRAERAMGA